MFRREHSLVWSGNKLAKEQRQISKICGYVFKEEHGREKNCLKKKENHFIFGGGLNLTVFRSYYWLCAQGSIFWCWDQTSYIQGRVLPDYLSCLSFYYSLSCQRPTELDSYQYSTWRGFILFFFKLNQSTANFTLSLLLF